MGPLFQANFQHTLGSGSAGQYLLGQGKAGPFAVWGGAWITHIPTFLYRMGDKIHRVFHRKSSGFFEIRMIFRC